MRLIDADAIKIKPVYMHDICGVVMIRVEDIARILNDMPTISPKPERKKGKWLAYGDIPKTCPYCHEDWDKYVYGEGMKMITVASRKGRKNVCHKEQKNKEVGVRNRLQVLS